MAIDLDFFSSRGVAEDEACLLSYLASSLEVSRLSCVTLSDLHTTGSRWPAAIIPTDAPVVVL